MILNFQESTLISRRNFLRSEVMHISAGMIHKNWEGLVCWQYTYMITHSASVQHATIEKHSRYIEHDLIHRILQIKIVYKPNLQRQRWQPVSGFRDS